MGKQLSDTFMLRMFWNKEMLFRHCTSTLC